MLWASLAEGAHIICFTLLLLRLSAQTEHEHITNIPSAPCRCCYNHLSSSHFRNGQLRELSNVLLHAEQSWLSWSYDLLVRRPTQTMFNVFVKKPMMWTFSKLFSNEKHSTEMSTYTGTVTSSSALSDKQFVVIDVVKVL